MRLTVQSCEDVVEAGDNVRTAYVDDASVGGNSHSLSRPGRYNLPVANRHDRIANVGLRANDSAAGEDERGEEIAHPSRWRIPTANAVKSFATGCVVPMDPLAHRGFR